MMELQEAIEAYLIGFIRAPTRCSIDAKRVNIMPLDTQLSSFQSHHLISWKENRLAVHGLPFTE